MLDLGNVPASDYFPSLDDPGEDPRWPLQLYMCRRCALVQLGPSAHPEPNPPKAIESATALAHAAASAAADLRAGGHAAGGSGYRDRQPPRWVMAGWLPRGWDGRPRTGPGSGVWSRTSMALLMSPISWPARCPCAAARTGWPAGDGVPSLAADGRTGAGRHSAPRALGLSVDDSLGPIAAAARSGAGTGRSGGQCLVAACA